MARITRVFMMCVVLGIALLPLEGSLIRSAHAGEPAVVASADSVDCIAAPEIEAPPLDLIPKPASNKVKSQRVPTLDPGLFEPVCPEGKVPLPKESHNDKGNPFLGNQKGYSANRSGENTRYGIPGQGQRGSDRMFGGCDGVAWFGSCYYYASAVYHRVADGGGMTTVVYRPDYVRLTAEPGHTLNEIAIQGGPGDGHIVEVGWNVSTDQYGDADPHLFVFHWIDWVGTCYDGCGWVQYSSTYFPGMNLSAIIGRPVYVGYVYYEGNWWAWFDNQWLGYFPGSEWGGSFTTSTVIQWFGEVSSGNGIPPRTDMGNGLFPTDPAAAVMSTLCDVNAADWVCWYRNEHSLIVTQPAYYDILRTGFGQVRWGGTGE